MQIAIIVHYCDAHYAYLLSFPRYNDLLIENLHFLSLLGLLIALSFEATAKELPLGSMPSMVQIW